MSTFVRSRFSKPMIFLLAVLVAAVAVLSVNLARPAQALGVSAVSASPNTLGATAQISFQVTNQSANTAEEIRVDFLANTFGVPQTIPATAVTVTGETVLSVAITGGTRVTISLAAPGIPSGSTAAVTFTPAAGITNPTTAGNYTLSVSTEEEATPLASADLSIVGQVQNLTATLTPNTAGVMDVTALLTFRVAQNTVTGTVTGATVSIGFPAEPNGAASNEFTVPTTITPAQVQVRAGATAAEAVNAQPLNPGGVAVTDGDNIVAVAISLPLGVDVDGTPNLVETGRFIAVRFLPAAAIDSPTVPGTFPLTVSTSVDTAVAQSSVTLTTAAPAAQAADLRVSTTDSPDPVQTGQQLTYTVTVVNEGPDTATAVTLTDLLVGGINLVAASPSQGNCSGTNPITCALGALSNGASATVVIVVTAQAPGMLINIAAVSSGTPDPRFANNVSQENTKVRTALEPSNLGRIEFRGRVQQMPQGGNIGAWNIQGLTVQVTASTEVKDTPQVGSFVKVEGHLTADGVVQAKAIKADKPEKGRDKKEDNGNRPGHGRGDRNHEHMGPPGHDDDDDDNHRPGKGDGKGKSRGRGD